MQSCNGVFFREGTKCAMGNLKIYEAIAKVQT